MVDRELVYIVVPAGALFRNMCFAYTKQFVNGNQFSAYTDPLLFRASNLNGGCEGWEG